MAYEPKPNSGTLWPNDYKKQDSHPDLKGDVFIDRDLLEGLMMEHPTGLIKVAIAGWKKNLNGKDIVSISASKPYVKPADDEIPY